MVERIMVTSLMLLLMNLTLFSQIPEEGPSIAWPVEKTPVPIPWKELCKTDSGRIQIIENLDSLSKRDLYFQWEGIRFQNDSLIGSFDEYLKEYISEICAEKPGYVFNYNPNYQYFYYTGAPGQIKSIYCRSENTGGGTKYDCDLESLLGLPKGWQACKLLYDIKKRRHGKLTVTPSLLIDGDIQNPPRFRGYKIQITGHGDVDNASYVYLSNVRIFAILENMSMAERKKCGCDLPMPPVQNNPSAPKPTPQTQVKTPAKMNGFIANRRENAIDIIISNTGGTRGRMLCYIEVKDGDTNNWKAAYKGYFDLDPNTVYTHGLHEWRALDWRIIYMTPSEIR